MSSKDMPVEEVEGFSEEEKAAMQERSKELKAKKKGKSNGERDVFEKINEMVDEDRVMAERIHAIVKANAPDLSPKTWYGMPAYANKEGKVICFFQSAAKFKARYSTLGFSDTANLDEGSMWPTAFALKKITASEEERIIALLKNAIS